MEPEEITVIVHGAKGLHGKKKDRHKFSVIFGVGERKFRTATDEEHQDSPVWTEESIIKVNPSDENLQFTVKEKDDVLGQVVVPIPEIPSVKFRRRSRVELQAHKKCPFPQGSLMYECWVSKYREELLPPVSENVEKVSPAANRKSNTLGKLRDKLHKSPLMGRKFKGDDPSESQSEGNLVSSRKKMAMSLSDLTQLDFKRKKNPFSMSPSSKRKAVLPISYHPSSELEEADMASGMHKKFPSTANLIEEDLVPEVTGISPKEGPVSGGTRITLRGMNLGENKEDVVGLFICGANCLSTVEYESSKKLYCTTKSWKPLSGHIVVETQSGGKGKSLVQFTFVRPPPPPPPPSDVDSGIMDVENSSAGSSPLVLRTKAASVKTEDQDSNRGSYGSNKGSPASVRGSRGSQRASQGSEQEFPDSYPAEWNPFDVPDGHHPPMPEKRSSGANPFDVPDAGHHRSHKAPAPPTPDRRYSAPPSPDKRHSAPPTPDKRHANTQDRERAQDAAVPDQRSSVLEGDNNNLTPTQPRMTGSSSTEHRKDDPNSLTESGLLGLLHIDSGKKEKRDSEAQDRKKEMEEAAQREGKLTAEVEHLRKQNKGLKEQNESLKLYIDKLVSRVILTCPEALCSDPIQ